MSRLRRHLEELEAAIGNWLEYTYYDQASPDMQRKMRAAAMIPSGGATSQPLAYRLWRSCQNNNCLWWDGGMANQPVVLMMEFAVCKRAMDDYQSYVDSVMSAIGQ